MADVAYFFVTFVNGDYKIGRILQCYKEGYIRIGRNVYPTTSIEMIERIQLPLVEEIYRLVNDKEIDERELKKIIKEKLMIPKRPSYVFAFYNDEWGYDIYVGYIENSLL